MNGYEIFLMATTYCAQGCSHIGKYDLEHRHLWLEGGGDADTNAGMEGLERVCSIRGYLSRLSSVHMFDTYKYLCQWH